MEKGGKVGQRPERELSMQMGGGYMTLTCHLNCFNCHCYRPIRHGSLSALPEKIHGGEALNIQKICLNT